MLTKLLRKTDLGQLRSLVSPAFFDVLPRRLLWSEGKRLVGNYRDRDGFRLAVEQRSAALERCAVPVLVDFGIDVDTDLVTRPESFAANLVTLYFHQLWFGERTILDLRASAIIEGEGDTLVWRPGPLWTEWEPTFISAIRDIYGGFYADDTARFRRGLSGLGLDGAGPLFKAQFGEDTSATSFELEHFIQSFHNIFVFCRDQDIELASGFLPLGVCLATMYENLDRLSVTVDVRQCFERATQCAGRPMTLGLSP